MRDLHLVHDEPSRFLLLVLLPIGDTICILPTVTALRNRYPHVQITALAYRAAAPLLRCVPEIDDVHILALDSHPRRLMALVQLIRTLRARRFDVTIDFTSPMFRWLRLLSGASSYRSMQFELLWWLLPGKHRLWRQRHLTEQYYRCATSLGLPPWSALDPVPRLPLPADAQAEARSFLRLHQLGKRDRPLIGIHPGGNWLGGLKRWPASRFAALAERLQERQGATVLLFGGEEDRHLAEEIAVLLPRIPLKVVGDRSLIGSLALLEQCDLFIGNDSMLLHAAAALGTPYVGIFGPTSVDNFRPLARTPRQGVLVLPDSPCSTLHYSVGGDVVWRRRCCTGICSALASIAVDAVYAAAVQLLALRPAPLQNDSAQLALRVLH